MQVKKISQLLKPELARFEERFFQMLNWSPTGLSSHLEALQGKRLRPILLMLSAKAIAPRLPLKDSHYNIAVIIELIHNATLIHDDVLDEAKLRRNVPTFNADYDNEMAVLFGDYLFSQAFVGCADVNSQAALKLLSSISAQMCLGELRHMNQRFGLDLSEADYFLIIRQKTASLFSAAAYLGALQNTANNDYLISAREYGENFGIAYQIMDDYMDIVNSTRQSDKSAGSDLAKGKVTLPIIRMLETANGDKRNKLMKLISADGLYARNRHQQLYKLLVGSDALGYTRDYIRCFVTQSQQALKPYKPSPYKDALIDISEQIAATR